MKFTAKLTAAFLAAVVAVTGNVNVLADYYETHEYPTVTAEDLEYTKYDITKIETLRDELSELLKSSGNLLRIEEIVNEMATESTAAASAYTLATLESGRDLNDTTSAQASEAYDIASDASKIATDVIKSVYNSSYKYAITEVLGEEEAREMIDSLPSDEFYALSEEAERLTTEYDKYYDTDVDKCADIFVELVTVRNKLAKEAGYDNYAEYAYNAVYNRDFTMDDATELSHAVYDYSVNLLDKLTYGITAIYMTMYTDGGSLMRSAIVTDEQTMLDDVGRVIEDISPELGISYEYMRRSNLYDISYSDKKSSSIGAFTTNISSLGVPYLFINPTSDYSEDATDTIATLIHEFGHFSSMLNEPTEGNEWYDEYAPKSIDFAEVHSLGLEVLAHKYYGKLFGAGAQVLNYAYAYNTVSTIISGCIYNEWQRKVYEAENLTVDMCDELMYEAMSEYSDSGLSKDDMRELWVYVPHNFNAPMYYISYAVSGLAALEIFEQSLEDYSVGVDTYMKASSIGSYVKFTKALGNVGIPDIFDEANIKSLFENLSFELGLDYSDVSMDTPTWYIPYVYGTTNIFAPRSDNKFEPNAEITRGEFAELIYNWYGFYDVEETIEYSEDDDAQAWCVRSGIMEGYDKDNFGSSDPLTREMVATVFKRLSDCENYESKELTGELPSDYGSCSEWAGDGVKWSVANGLMTGDENGLLHPQNNCTRAEAAKMISEFTGTVSVP